MSHRRVQKETESGECIGLRFGHSLWSAIKLQVADEWNFHQRRGNK